MQGLPTHQHVLTSLINAIETSASSDAIVPEQAQSRPIDRRRLLLTLHVLFPTLLLPALDLLDRRLVTRVVLGEAVMPPPPAGAPGTASGQPTTGFRPLIAVDDTLGTYIVKSAAAPPTRRTRNALPTSAAASSRTYLVRLDAWHCSCASFALEAFPARTVAADAAAGTSKTGGEDDDWGFGGHRPGSLAGSAPCCKHLLACLLTRKCGTMTDGRVEHRNMSREELAGIITDM